MSWLPRFSICRACICDIDGEAEGITLSLGWGRFVAELTIARQVRRVNDRDEA